MLISSAYAGSLPIQGTAVAGLWDNLYNFLFWLSVFFFILVVGGMVYFAVKYRRGAGHTTKYIKDNHVLEAVWTVIPLILLMVIFGWGYVVYDKMTRTPGDAMEIKVIGKQWLWQFQYADGRMTVNELYVPANQPVKLVMSSQDVLHSFFVPNFRVKQDVVPGMYTSVWFEATVEGRHQIYCTEYCGTSHSEMLAHVNVLNDEQWKNWKLGKKPGNIPLAGGSAEPETAEGAIRPASLSLVDQGKALTESKGCVACHSSDGSRKIGPTFKGVYGHKVEFADGTSAEVDENYLRESIVNPQAKLVKTYSGVMPTFKGLLDESEMNAVISYIKSLK